MIKELGSFVSKNFQRRENGVMKVIIINTIVFMVLLLTKSIFVLSGYELHYYAFQKYLLLPALWEDFLYRPWTLITYFFTHERFFPMLFNLLMLHIFFFFIMDFLGSKKFVALYIMGGIVGGIFFLVLHNLLPAFKGVDTQLIGSSAGMYAVIIGVTTFAPNLPFNLPFLGSIRIKYIALFLLVLFIFEFSSANPGGSVAQLGGALLGYVYISQLKKGIDLSKPFTNFFAFLKKLFRKKHAATKVTYKNPTRPLQKDENKGYNQEEIDAILDKIAQYGYKSLTEAEKRKLFDAGKQG